MTMAAEPSPLRRLRRTPTTVSDPLSPPPRHDASDLSARFRQGVSKLVRFVSITLGLVVVLLALLLVALHFVLNALVLDYVEQRLNRDVSAESLRLSVFREFRLDMIGLAVREFDSPETLFRADRIQVVLPLSSLLRGAPLIAEHLIVERPWLAVHRDRDGQWAIPAIAGMEGKPSPEDERGTNTHALVPARAIRLTEGIVVVTDDFRRPGEQAGIHTLTGLEGSLSVADGIEAADVQVSARLPAESQLSTLTLVGRLSRSQNVPIGVQFDGMAQVALIDVRKVAGLFIPQAQANQFDGAGHLGVQFQLAAQADGYELFLSQFDMRIDDIALSGRGYIEGLGTEDAAYALTVSSVPLRIERLIEWYPIDLLPAEWRQFADEAGPGGIVELLAVTVTADGQSVDISGDAALSGGHLLLGSERTPIRDLSAGIRFSSDHVQVTDLRGAYGAVRVSGGVLQVSDLRQSPTLTLTATGEGKAADLVRMLAAHDPTTDTARTLTHLEDIEGDLDLALHLAGPLPGGVRLLSADITAHDVAFSRAQGPLAVRRLNGDVRITPAGVDLNHVYARIGPISVETSGRIEVGERPGFHDVTIAALADAPELGRFVSDLAGGSTPAWDGPVRLAARLSGPLSAPRLSGAIDLSELSVVMGKLFHKPHGAPAAVEFAAVLSPEHLLTVQKLALILPPAQLVARGHVTLVDEPVFAMTIRSRPIAVARLPVGLSLGPLTAGRLSTALEVKGRGLDWTAWDMAGSITLEEGVAVVEGFDQPLKNMSVRLDLDQKDVRIQRAGLTVGTSDVQASGLVRQWREAPRITLDVTSPDLDLAWLNRTSTARATGQESGSALSGDWLDDLDLTAAVNIGRAHYKHLVLANVAGHIRVSEGRFRIDRLKARTDQGRLGAELAVAGREAAAPLAEGAWRFNGVPVEDVLAVVGPEQMLTGRLSMEGHVRAPLRDASALQEGLKSVGDIHVLIEDGRIKSVPLIAGLLKIVNLPALVQGQVDLRRDGLAFQKLAGVFAADRGVVTVKQLYLEGPLIKISGTGTYDLIADQFDLAMAASPLQSYSSFLGSIPILGRLLAGDRQGFGTTLFSVKGPLREPDIKVLPFESLAGGVTGLFQFAYDVLVNTVTLPANLFIPRGDTPE
jgi:hypothetical protein